MAYLPGFEILGLLQHVIQRGNNRQEIFRVEAKKQWITFARKQKFRKVNRVSRPTPLLIDFSAIPQKRAGLYRLNFIKNYLLRR